MNYPVLHLPALGFPKLCNHVGQPQFNPTCSGSFLNLCVDVWYTSLHCYLFKMTLCAILHACSLVGFCAFLYLFMLSYFVLVILRICFWHSWFLNQILYCVLLTHILPIVIETGMQTKNVTLVCLFIPNLNTRKVP